MVSIISKLLMNPYYFRYAFFILLISSIILNRYIIHDSNFYILYIFSTIFLGIGFFNKSNYFLITFTTIIVLCRFYLIPDASANIGTFLIYLFTYYLITYISVGLMKNLQKVKKDNLELVNSLSNALDSRDPYTNHHSENVARYAVAIAKEMNLSQSECNSIHVGGLLHDIGKIGIPEQILKKPERLTNKEYEYIKSHTTMGFKMLKHVSSFKDNGILDIILYHHERYDGKGYPSGLKGNQIPLAARIIALADTFDALTSKRVYRNELDLDYTLNEIRKNKGTQFDPEIVDVFLSLLDSTNNDLYKLKEKYINKGWEIS
ncbi:HD-GYP domain-containing protein [Neobacillus cucumis]|uniref:Diguanylate cyclase n=1 Tax=Neobacillus cucumis TaxID=1740721 RepID=A0A2N5HEP3_9BACI|nr:HD-GYP domain-containing protein [Neobacillus cucumis]PLS04006.1 diguanylate cyclase [Neobacillus cucumis]